MKKQTAKIIATAIITTSLGFSSFSYAEQQQTIDCRIYNCTNYSAQPSYGRKVGTKALSGISNIGTSFLELPKNIINETNDSNILFGLTIGTIAGLAHATSRLGAGIADLITAPIPTTPIVTPNHVWKDFDVTTTYGDGLRFKDRPK